MNKINRGHAYWEPCLNRNLREDGTTLDFSGWWPFRTEETRPTDRVSEGVSDYIEKSRIEPKSNSLEATVITSPVLNDYNDGIKFSCSSLTNPINYKFPKKIPSKPNCLRTIGNLVKDLLKDIDNQDINDIYKFRTI